MQVGASLLNITSSRSGVQQELPWQPNQDSISSDRDIRDASPASSLACNNQLSLTTHNTGNRSQDGPLSQAIFPTIPDLLLMTDNDIGELLPTALLQLYRKLI
jgi:hypothetical protein